LQRYICHDINISSKEAGVSHNKGIFNDCLKKKNI